MKKIVFENSNLLVLIIAIFVSLVRKNTVTVYLGVANAKINEMPLQVSIDGSLVFKDTLVNNPFEYKLLKTELSTGLHSLTLLTDEYKEQTSFFVALNQHLVVEFYSPWTNEIINALM